MDLILWRHAEALDLDSPDEDMARALTPKGERQAQRMAGWLNRQLPAGTRILASPARRCQQSAQALERKLKTTDSLAPGAAVESLLHAARWPDARELGLAAAYLLVGQPLAWSVRKGGVWWLRAREREGALQVVLHAVLSPELL